MMSRLLSTKYRILLVVLLGGLFATPSAVLSQVAGTDAKALAQWMDAYVNLPAAPSSEELPRYVPAWFDEIELRTETDEFMLNRQRYNLRGKPRLPHVRRAERRVQNAQRAGLNDLGKEALADGRADALSYLFELATDVREAALVDTIFQVQSRLVDVTRLRVVEPGYDVEKVLDAEDELAKIDLRLKELQSISNVLAPPVRPDALAQLEQIRFRLLALLSEGPSAFPGQQVALETIDAEMALERAENMSFLKFLQVEYRSSPDPDDLTRELLSVGGSISFPKRERNIRQLDELKVKRLEEIYDLEIKKQEQLREFNDAVSTLQRAFKQYDEFKSKIVARKVRRERLSQTYLQASTARPEALLRLSRRNLSDRLNLLQIEEDIREGYAALLGDYVTLDAAGIQRWVLK